MEKHSFSFHKYCTLCPASGLSQKASVKIASVRKHKKVNYFAPWVLGGPSEADQSTQQGFSGCASSGPKSLLQVQGSLVHQEFKQKPWTCSDAFANTQHRNFYTAQLETGLWATAHIKPALPEEQHLADSGGDRFQVVPSSWEVLVLSLKPLFWFSHSSDLTVVTDFILVQAICLLLTILMMQHTLFGWINLLPSDYCPLKWLIDFSE